MPVRDLVLGLAPQGAGGRREIADGLEYAISSPSACCTGVWRVTPFPTTGLHPGVGPSKVGRLQGSTNGGPWMVSESGDHHAIGMEYFGPQRRRLWTMSDAEFSAWGIEEMQP